MLIATIVARNYLPQARVLARSFLEHHPDGRVVALVVDAPGEGLRDDEPFEVITPGHLATDPAVLDTRVLQRMATIYTVLELSTALKPFLLRHLVHDRAEPAATYLDPDIQVFAPLDDIDALAREHGIVLTPHRTHPVPDDGRQAYERVLVTSGAYNLGFISVSGGALPFLDWWAENCRRDCVLAPAEGLFVDQRWLDLGVTYFPHHVLRDPGCNVAYWNLDGRPLATTRLRFFHFSGYDPDVPHLLSVHQGPQPRVLLSEEPELRALCADYAARLEAEGWRECRKLAYGLDHAANGMRIDPLMRRIYRREILQRRIGQPHGIGTVDELPNPFDPAQVDAFVALLRSPFPGSAAPRISRYLHALHDERLDLQREFPSLTGEAGNHYLWWVREMGHTELGVPLELIPTPDDLYPAPPPGPVERPEGVRVVGYLEAELGVGEAGRAMTAALHAAGEPFRVLASDNLTSNRQNARPYHEGDGPADGDVNLICVNADRFGNLLERLEPDARRGRHTVGVWGWEVEDFPPAHAAAAEHVDEVWTYSRHAAAAIRAAVDKPVHVVPLPVVERRPSGRGRAELGVPDGFVFLFCFDFFSILARKNPLGAIEAFTRAFPTPSAPGSGGPQLIVKSINGDRQLAELERLRMRVIDRPDVHVRDGYLDPGDHLALVAACDAYVSLHRAEGFGYTMAEAMLLGKPVIATGYSGNLEFMDERNSFLVEHSMVPIGEGAEPYPAWSRWAEPDVDHAASLMRRVVEDPAGAREVAERGRHDVRTWHS
ncbi:MAG TPA: glycosyltransferase, partial [Acidimicrobiales bacterium]